MSAAPVSLFPLQCIRCQNAIAAAPDEVAWVCDQCGQGQMLSADGGLAPLEIHYSNAIAPNASGFPYWVVQGSASLTRKTYSGNASAEMQAFWSAPKTFFIPAFELSLEELQQRGAALLRQPPPLIEGTACRFAPVTCPPEDIRPLAEFVVITIEAERPDMLRELHFELALSDTAQLWVLP